MVVERESGRKGRKEGKGEEGRGRVEGGRAVEVVNKEKEEKKKKGRSDSKEDKDKWK